MAYLNVFVVALCLAAMAHASDHKRAAAEVVAAAPEEKDLKAESSIGLGYSALGGYGGYGGWGGYGGYGGWGYGYPYLSYSGYGGYGGYGKGYAWPYSLAPYSSYGYYGHGYGYPGYYGGGYYGGYRGYPYYG